MAPFDEKELAANRWQRLDFLLVRDGPCTLFHKQKVLEETVSWLERHNYLTYTLNCSEWQTKSDMHDALSATLDFPDYYGKNLDAFNDCMRDIQVPQEGGVAIVFLHYDRYARREHDSANAVLDIMVTQSRSFLLYGQILITLVQSDDPNISFEPVGATSVTWNAAERSR